MMKAVFEIVSENAKEMHDAIACESSFTSRSKVDVCLDEAKLLISIEAKDFNALRAASNSYLRMLKASQETLKAIP